MSSAGTVQLTYNDSDYQVPVDPMDDLQCESCQ
jgi:hypothetical protein